MPEDVSVHPEQGLARVHSFGAVTKADLVRSLEVVAQACQEHGIRMVLVDAQEETSLPSASHLFEFGAKLLTSKLPRDCKLAMVVSQGTKKDLGFLENVTQNRGMLVHFVRFRGQGDDLAEGVAAPQERTRE